MSAPDIRAVLFDMDGVLYAYDFEARLGLLESALEVSKEDIRSKIFDSGFDDQHDQGLIDVDSYISGIADRLGVPVRVGQWLAARKWAMAPEPAMLDLARALKANHQIALLTNNGQFLADAVAEVAPELLEIFEDRMFFSGVVGLSKDFSASFATLLNKLDWAPAQTLFVDDHAGYIEQAAAAGLHTHLFTDIDSLRATLAEFNVAV